MADIFPADLPFHPSLLQSLDFWKLLYVLLKQIHGGRWTESDAIGNIIVVDCSFHLSWDWFCSTFGSFLPVVSALFWAPVPPAYWVSGLVMSKCAVRQVCYSLMCFVLETGMFAQALASLWHFIAGKSLQWSYTFSVSAKTEADLVFLWSLLFPFPFIPWFCWYFSIQSCVRDRNCNMRAIKAVFWIEVLDKTKNGLCVIILGVLQIISLWTGPLLQRGVEYRLTSQNSRKLFTS